MTFLEHISSWPARVVRKIDPFLTSEATFPRCDVCGNYVTYNKATEALSHFCSAKCNSLKNKIACPDVDKLKRLRYDEKRSKEDVARAFGVSEPTISKWIESLSLPVVRYNESSVETTRRLSDAEYLRHEHKVEKKTCADIASQIGSSTPTVARWLHANNIEPNKPNEYPRRQSSQSSQEQEVSDYIKGLGFDVLTSDRSLLGNGYEIDIVVPAAKLAIEFNGLYHHLYRPDATSFAAKKGPRYHKMKTMLCAKHGYQLIHVFSDQWEQHADIVKSMLSSHLRCNNRIFARKCTVAEVTPSDRAAFLRRCHIQGSAPSAYGLGLVHDGKLVSVMTFGKSRYNKRYDFELVRFASSLNTTVVGGFSKLLAAFRKEHHGSIITYADYSYSDGAVYKTNGFTLDHVNEPSYMYVSPDMHRTFNRARFMKKAIAPNDPRPEWMVMEGMGYRRIWNCGTAAFVLR